MTASRTIDVALTGDAVRPASVAVVLDVLRASSTIVASLEAGYRRTLCAESLEAARRLRRPGRVLAGERGCVPPTGFDLGNSPRALPPACGKELVLSTTNGTPAVLAAARHADRVIIGALVNLGAVAAAVGDGDVLIVCAGTGGRPAVEDVYAAGRLSALLPGRRTDAATIAERTALALGDPPTALSAGDSAARLRRLGLEDDIAWCAQVSVADAVPTVTAVVDGVACIKGQLADLTDKVMEPFAFSA